MRKKVAESLPTPRYMTVGEVAHELRYDSDAPIYELIEKGFLHAAPVSPTNSTLRVLRTSFDAFCAARDAEGARRFGAA